MQASPLHSEFASVYHWLMQQVKPMVKAAKVNLLAAQNRVLAEEIYAPISVPVCPQSAMDGYAFNSLDKTPLLSLLAPCFAGNSPTSALLKGHAQRVMTGAAIPQGCDAVLPIEYACLQTVNGQQLLHNPNLGQHKWHGGKHIKAVGSDVCQGEKLLAKGQRLNAKHLGLLASVGVHEVRVFAQPKVALVTLGDELIAPGESLALGEVYNSNAYLLQGLLAMPEIELITVKHLADDREQIAASLAQLSEQTDLIITVGGSSVGDRDWLPVILKEWSQASVYKVSDYQRFKMNMRPAKPLLAAKIGTAQLLGLPGNPIAAYFSFQLFAKPYLIKLSGRSLTTVPAQSLPITADFAASDKLRWILVKQVGDRLQPLNFSSSQLKALVEADGFVRINPQQTVHSGEGVPFFAEKMAYEW